MPGPLIRAILIALTLLACLSAAAAASASPVRSAPSGGAFYHPPHRLLAGPHGSVIWAQRVQSPLANAGRAYRVLYRSASVNGRPIAVSGLIDLPRRRAPHDGWPVVSWAHGTIGIADGCAPSRDLGAPVNSYAFQEFDSWLQRGYVLARTDYEGLGTSGTHPYLVGTSEGRGVVDIIRAARVLDRRVGRRWVVAGHSQGGQAALFAAALGQHWAPELSLRGVAAFAPAAHLDGLLRILGVLRSPSPASATVALLTVGAAAVDSRVEPDRLLSDPALGLLPRVQRDCILALGGPAGFGSLAPADMLRPGADVRPLQRVASAENPALRIGAPVLVLQGLDDSTVPASSTSALVAELRAKRDKVTYRTYPGVEHIGVVRAGAAAATSFFAARLR